MAEVKPPEEISGKKIYPTLMWGAVLGPFGAHRFYVGRIWSGALMCLFNLAAMGLAGWTLLHLFTQDGIDLTQLGMMVISGFAMFMACVWAFVDCLLISQRKFRDVLGRRLEIWK